MYRYVLPTFIVLLLVTAMATLNPAQATDEPSVASEPTVQSLRSGPEAETLLHALCPVEQAVDTTRLRCRGCPEAASAQDGILRLRRVYRGHLSDGNSLQAIVSLRGCTDDGASSNATAFFEQTGGEWRQVDYLEDLNTSSCRTPTIGDRPALICRDFQLESDANRTEIFSLRHTDDGWQNKTLLELYDRSAKCFGEGEVLRRLHSIHVGSLLEDDAEAIGLLVESHRRTANTEAPDRCDSADFDRRRQFRLHVYQPADSGLERVEFDDICSHPARARILDERAPGTCR